MRGKWEILRIWRFKSRKVRLFAGLLVGSGILISGLLLCESAIQRSLPEFSQFRTRHRLSDVWLVDRNGIPLEVLRIGLQDRRLEWVSLNEVSPVFLKLLVESEDRRFAHHAGVDWIAAGSGLLGVLGPILNPLLQKFGKKKQFLLRGASTLTMQLVGLIAPATLGNHGRLKRHFGEKMIQILNALQLEKIWSKEQILEAYINSVPFRGEFVGLPAASLGFFGKAAVHLSVEESALLVAQIRAPNAGINTIANRACRLLRNHSWPEGSSCPQVRQLAFTSLFENKLFSRQRSLVPIVADAFLKNSGHRRRPIDLDQGRRMTTLDINVQMKAMELVRDQLHYLSGRHVQDAAVLGLDGKTGDVLGYVGNAGRGVASRDQIDGIQMRRQAGSTLKPFLYATALDMGILKTSSLIDDSPADIPVGAGSLFHPRNYDHIFRGPVSVGEALASSLNVPAVRVLMMVGEDKLLQRLKDLGFRRLNGEDFYGPSLALGTVDVSLWELTQGFRKLVVGSEVFSKLTTKSIYDVLAAPEYRRFTFGWDSSLNLPFSAAVKTGTSKDMRDNWCVGGNERFVVGVWVGNFSGEPMWNVSGVHGAAPLWQSLMLYLQTGSGLQWNPALQFSSQSFPLGASAPSGRPVVSRSGQNLSRILARRSLSYFRYPARDMLIGLDPDIPAASQKVYIEIENPQLGHEVIVDGVKLGAAKQNLFWAPQRGNHNLVLMGRDGVVVDEVKFQVR